MAPPRKKLSAKDVKIPKSKPTWSAFNPLKAMRHREDSALAAIAAKKKQQQEQRQRQQASRTGAAASGAGPRKLTCPNNSCTNPNIVDGVCQNCGRIADDSNIVSEVQFGESSTGAAVVQGQFLAADQGGVATSHPALRRIGGHSDNRERSIREAKDDMERMAHHLGIPTRIVHKAVQIFKLAIGQRFTQGRRLPTVHAVCLYLACRITKDGGENEDGLNNREAYEDIANRKPSNDQIMLIDFADLIQVNVFKLGRAFKALHTSVYVGVGEGGWLPIAPEDLIYRFAARLEFLHETEAVATTAVRLVKRMSLDMMAEGRRPSGVCGACLIMAARMHNFRRSVREVVYIVKVTMETIRVRMDEFRSTEASGLTVEDFLSQHWLTVPQANPPAFYHSEHAKAVRQRERERKRKRKRPTSDDGNEEDAGAETNQAEEEDQSEENAPNPELVQALSSLPSVEYQRDDRGRIVIPPTEFAERIDGESEETVIDGLGQEFGDQEQEEQEEQEKDQEQEGEKETGKKRKQQKGPSLNIDGAWQEEENEIEEEITELINDPATIQHAKAWQAAEKRAKAHSEIATRNLKGVSMNPIVEEDEFANDPEVQTCVLSEEEVRKKEVIWVNENEAHLRKQQAKLFNSKIAANMPKPTRRKKKAKVSGEQTGPAASAGEAAYMVAQRLNFTDRIDWDVFHSMFDGQGGPRSATTKSMPSHRASRDGSGERGEEGQEAEDGAEDAQGGHHDGDEYDDTQDYEGDDRGDGYDEDE